MTDDGERVSLMNDPDPTQLAQLHVSRRRHAPLCERQSRRLDSVVPVSANRSLPSIISYAITCTLSVPRTVANEGQPRASMDREAHHTTCHDTYPKVLHKFFRIASPGILLLVILLAGCQSTQDIYLAHTTDHVTGVERERALYHLSDEQTTDARQLRGLYHQDSGETEGHDLTPLWHEL